MLLSHTGGLPWCLPVALIEAKEDVLEARLVARQGDNWIPGGGLDHRVGGTLHRKADGRPVVQCLHVDDAVKLCERASRHRARKRNPDLVTVDVREVGDGAHLARATLAEDADATAGLLNFAQDARREKGRAAS